MGDGSLGHAILDLIPTNQASLAAIEAHGNVNRLIKYKSSKGRIKALRLAFGTPPRDVKAGFVVGNAATCDLVFYIPPTDSPWRFTITFNTQSGIPLVVNMSPAGVCVGDRCLTRVGDCRVIEKNTLLRFGQYSFMACVPDRGRYQEHYQDQLGRYLGYVQTAGTAIITKTYSKPVVARKRIDQYLEIDSLGSGAFGEVCLLAGEWNGHVFAAKKFLDPRNSMAIYQEVSTLQKLRHNNIVNFVGCVHDNAGSIYLVMEYLSFGHLYEFHVPEYCAIEILKQCLDGLNYIHYNGIIHRDIKPNNLVLRSLVPIHACIIDFGLAILGPQAACAGGTIVYMPPEVWAGHPPTPKIDIWGLGLTGLHLFGKFPDEESVRFNANQSPERLQAYVYAIFRKMGTLPGVVRGFFEGMLARDAGRRWPAPICLDQIGPVQQYLSTVSSTGRSGGRSGGCPTIRPRHTGHRSHGHSRRSSRRY